MGMMLLDDDAFKTELQRFGFKVIDKAELSDIIKVVDINRGRPFGKLEVPQSIREEIAKEAIVGTPVQEIVERFNTSPSSISAYKNGATSTASYNEASTELIQANNEVKETLTDSARSALRSALLQITPDKLSLAKVRDAAGIAKDMSAVMKNLEPTNPQQQNNVQVVIYKPRTKDEDSYDVITVNE